MPTLREAPSNARSRRTRKALLAAALALLHEHGFEALTIGAVADRAGVSRRAVYLHFSARSALVGALFDYVAETDGLEASLRRVREAPDAMSALDEWARHESTFHARALGAMSALEHVGRADPDAAIWRQRIAEYQMLDCRALAQRLDDEHRLARGWTVDTAADMLWALLPTDVLERLLVNRGWTAARYRELYFQLLRSTFVAPDVSAADTSSHPGQDLEQQEHAAGRAATEHGDGLAQA